MFLTQMKRWLHEMLGNARVDGETTEMTPVVYALAAMNSAKLRMWGVSLSIAGRVFCVVMSSSGGADSCCAYVALPQHVPCKVHRWAPEP